MRKINLKRTNESIKRINPMKSITTKITFAICLITIVSLLLEGFVFLTTSKNSLETSMNSDYSMKTDYLASVINGWILEDVSFIDAIGSIVDNQNNEDVQKSIESIINGHSEILLGYKGLSDGTVVLSNPTIDVSGIDVTTRPWYQGAVEHIGEVYATNPYVDEASDGMVITLSKAFVSDNKTYVIGLDVSVNEMLKELQSVVEEVINENDYLFIYAADGSIIYHPNSDYMCSLNSMIYVNDILDGEYVDNLNKFTTFNDYNGTDSCVTGSEISQTGWTACYVSPYKYYKDPIERMLSNMFYTAILIIIISIAISLIISIRISKPIKKANEDLTDIINDIENGCGDLSKKITVKKMDEVGELSKGINSFISTLNTITKQINSVSNKVADANKIINSNIGASSDNISEIGGVVEELSASMEVVATTCQELCASTEEVLNVTQSIVDESKYGSTLADEMSDRASQIRLSSSEQREDVNRTLDDKKIILEKAIEESKKVIEITSLTDEILNIASKTNLLALNASIEAARAGEAGKGFAVVADSIRDLADNSKGTAEEIQQISNEVIKSVQNLMSESQSLIDYMDSTMNDINIIITDISNNYGEDADGITGMLTKFNTGTENLKLTMNEMAENISNITTSIAECSSGVSDVAQNIESIMNSMNDISERSNENTDNINLLKKEIGVFKNE